VEGTLKAPVGSLPISGENWITINYVNNLEVSGGGVFDGQGQQAWKKNDCHKNTKCEQLPLNLSFNFINNSIIHDVTSKDSKNFHINLISSHNVTFSQVTISAPGDSPNTDGLHLARSSNVYVTDSVIETGDDCISIGDESKEFHITNVKCGPGHGISIGSLGKYSGEKDVTGIYVKKCTFKNTENGVRIKTWPSTSIKLKVSELHFEDLTMDNVTHPITIDQEYCPWNQCKLDSPSLVSITGVYIKEVRGTTNGADPIVLACSKSNPCQNVNIGNVNLQPKGDIKALSADAKTSKALSSSKVKSSTGLDSKCSNVKPILTGKQNIPICGNLASLST